MYTKFIQISFIMNFLNVSGCKQFVFFKLLPIVDDLDVLLLWRGWFGARNRNNRCRVHSPTLKLGICYLKGAQPIAVGSADSARTC